MRERVVATVARRELFGAMAIYAVILIPALRFGPTIDSVYWRALALASPMIGFWLVLWAVVRNFHRIDEFIRRLSLENVAIAAAVTAGWTFTYGFLENAGFPRLSMFLVMPIMGMVWGMLGCVRLATNR